MPPIKAWAGKGERTPREFWVLTIRDNGKKMPIIFAIRGVPGDRIEQEGHFYAMQENATMDTNVWKFH
ncbi:hypothetical protein F441_07650, partial [Phytophthora nicotianae CJ01A1]